MTLLYPPNLNEGNLGKTYVFTYPFVLPVEEIEAATNNLVSDTISSGNQSEQRIVEIVPVLCIKYPTERSR